ncbi:MAG: hypothetical protein IT170_08790 [Bryobacterales bacterium]|nr:hypothetical protein [Bryobacterales bacterium]
MNARALGVQESLGKILSTPIFKLSGKKLLAKGHILTEDDIRLLQTEGLDQVWVAELDAGEISEDEAVLSVSTNMAAGSLEIRLAAGGRANLVATENCCAVIDDDLLRQINLTSSIVIATVANFSYIRAGQRLAIVKSTPFAVEEEQIEAVLNILRERGPIIQARPIPPPKIGVLYTDPIHAERSRHLFENVMRQRLENYGANVNIALGCLEEEAMIANSLGYLLKAKPTAIVIASTTAPASPKDAVGRAIQRSGCSIERFLAPVEPGNLLLLAYHDEIPVIAAPGCYRSPKKNVLDVLLPPLLSGYRVSGWELAAFGNGGLLI